MAVIGVADVAAAIVVAVPSAEVIFPIASSSEGSPLLRFQLRRQLANAYNSFFVQNLTLHCGEESSNGSNRKRETRSSWLSTASKERY